MAGEEGQVASGFWTEWFWLPHGTRWSDLESTPEVSYPVFGHLLFPIPLALVIWFLRKTVES